LLHLVACLHNGTGLVIPRMTSYVCSPNFGVINEFVVFVIFLCIFR